MKRVFLTCGPRYSGKSTFCKALLKEYKTISMVSRDEILLRMYGTVEPANYGGEHFIAWDVLWKQTKRMLQKKEVSLILDAWNTFAKSRQEILEKLLALGADEVYLWYFVSPREEALSWYLNENPPNGK